MRILLAGAWKFPFYEEACSKSLKKLGVDVLPFAWAPYFSSLLGRIESKYAICGPCTRNLNRNFLNRAVELQPDVILIWGGNKILPHTLRQFRQRTTGLLVSYNNDDPCSPGYSASKQIHMRRLWRLFISTIPEYNIHFVYRQANIMEFNAAGSRATHLLRSYYIPEVHRPVEVPEDLRRKLACDVVFVGHYENDGRIEYLKALVDSGLKVKIFGGDTWRLGVLREIDPSLGFIAPVTGDEYARVMACSSMALCFLSKLNRDTYTRRCFEIPACRTTLVSERTSDLERMFIDGKEAVFFSSKSELTALTLELKSNPEKLRAIASAGRRRVIADRHSVDDRMHQALEIIQQGRQHHHGSVTRST